MAALIIFIQVVFFTLIMAQQPTRHLGTSSFSPAMTTLGVRTPPAENQCLLWNQVPSRRWDYTYTPGIGGHKLHTRAVRWNEARTICEGEGGHLAIINSIAESHAITELFRRSAVISGSQCPHLASIGFHDLYREGHYVTIHGQSLARAGFTQWVSGQPDNARGSENCGSVHRSGRLNDINCEAMHGFICEIPMYRCSNRA